MSRNISFNLCSNCILLRRLRFGISSGGADIDDEDDGDGDDEDIITSGLRVS
jgi:hypothetical protein